MNTIYEKRRKIVWKILEELHCSYDKKSVGLFVWAKIPKGKSATDFSDELLYDKNVFITPGTIFGSKGKDYIRISLCVNENDLTEVYNRIKA